MVGIRTSSFLIRRFYYTFVNRFRNLHAFKHINIPCKSHRLAVKSLHTRLLDPTIGHTIQQIFRLEDDAAGLIRCISSATFQKNFAFVPFKKRSVLYYPNSLLIDPTEATYALLHPLGSPPKGLRLVLVEIAPESSNGTVPHYRPQLRDRIGNEVLIVTHHNDSAAVVLHCSH